MTDLDLVLHAPKGFWASYDTKSENQQGRSAPPAHFSSPIIFLETCLNGFNFRAIFFNDSGYKKCFPLLPPASNSSLGLRININVTASGGTVVRSRTSHSGGPGSIL